MDQSNIKNTVQNKESTLLVDLNSAQKVAVSHEGGPLLIVAGAGTGKTTVITRRIAWLVLEKQIKPEQILALTFTDKAAGEMEERVDKLLPYGYVELWISTFHSFAERILRTHALDIGLPADFKLLDTTATWMLVRKNLNRFNLRYYRPLGNPNKFIHALLSHFSRAKDELIDPKQYLDHAEELRLNTDREILIDGEVLSNEVRANEIARLEEIANAYHVYEQLLLEVGALDFGGLLTWVIKLFRTRPHLLEHYRKQFKYILVDEFQDTNFAQYELVKLLAAPVNNITVVGDDDQSVYKFRGASISNILEFKADFPQAKEIFLIENYRSRQNILDLAHNFIQQNNPNRLEVRLGTAGLSKKLTSSKAEEGTISHLHTETVQGEARLTVETIIKLTQDNPELSWNDFAVLVRANDQANYFIRAFDESGVPYELVTARGLYTKPIILDLIAYGRILTDSEDNPSLYRVLTSPISHLSEQDLITVLNSSRRHSCSLFETLRTCTSLGLATEATSECQRIFGLLEKHMALARRSSAGKVIFAILEDTGYLKFLTKNDDENSRASLRGLNHFYKKILTFEATAVEPLLPKFLEELALEIESGDTGKIDQNPDDGPETVKILTCHAAKGLEFRNVFVVNMVDRRFPSTERQESIELPDALVKELLLEGDMHLEEERRLFYVACTRAKEGLFFTSANDYGGARKKKISRFLQELESLQCLAIADSPLSKTVDTATPKSIVLPKNEIKTVTLPAHVSYTQLKAFETCPLQYKFAHLLKIPVKGRPTFSFGRSIHRALQRFCELVRERQGSTQTDLFAAVQPVSAQAAGLPVTLEEMYGLYQESWQDEWFESAAQKSEYFEKGKQIIKLFYEDALRNPPKTVYLERSFHLKIGNYTVKGAVDRVDQLPDGTLEIIDYKTGAAKSEDKIDKDQLYIYQLALSEVLDGHPSKLTYYYVEDGSRVSFLGNSEQLAKLKDKIIAGIKAIEASSFPATPAKNICYFCDFKNICEKRIL